MAKRKKKTNEEDYEVAIQDTTPGAKRAQVASKVTAHSPEAAIRAASGGKPVTGAENVVVQKAGPNTGQGVVQEQKRPTMKSILEGVSYPYSVSLPKPFRGFLEDNGIEFTEVGHTLMVKYNNKSQLTEGIRELKKTDTSQAWVILNGIARSAK